MRNFKIGKYVLSQATQNNHVWITDDKHKPIVHVNYDKILTEDKARKLLNEVMHMFDEEDIEEDAVDIEWKLGGLPTD